MCNTEDSKYTRNRCVPVINQLVIDLNHCSELGILFCPTFDSAMTIQRQLTSAPVLAPWCDVFAILLIAIGDDKGENSH